jgi:hypothetical protein
MDRGNWVLSDQGFGIISIYLFIIYLLLTTRAEPNLHNMITI